MRIVIDARTGDGTGISRYTLNLVRELEKLPSQHEFVVLLGAGDFSRWEPANKRFTRQLVPFRYYTWGEQVGLLQALGKLNADLVHFTSFNAPLFYLRRRIFTIHDLTLVRFSNAKPGLVNGLVYRAKYWAMRAALRVAVKQSRALLAPSEFVKRDIGKHWGRAAAAKTTVTLEAVEKISHKKLDPPLEGEYLLYVGAVYPHKNLDRLVAAFAKIQAARPELKLVIIGKQDYWQQRLRERVAANSNVIFPGYVTNEELASYYQHAALFVFPSLSEGFGLPPLEAMAYGAPVLTSDATAMPETCGDAVEYFDPKSTADLVDKLELLLNNPRRLAELRKLGPEQAKKFSWKKMAEQTLAVYDKVLEKKK